MCLKQTLIISLQGLADMDITAFRLKHSGLTCTQIREMFNQSNDKRHDQLQQVQTLSEYLQREIAERMPKDESYIEMEEKLHNVVTGASTVLKVTDLGYGVGVVDVAEGLGNASSLEGLTP